MRFLRFVWLLSLSFVFECRTEDPSTTSNGARATAVQVPKPPTTLQEAVEGILSTLPGEDKARLRATPRGDLIQYLHSWGTGIRNGFQLWGGNQKLLEACGTESPEGASMVIMEAVWDRLNEK